MSRFARLLLIGLGAHAKRAYYPVAQRDGAEHGFEIAGIVDLDRNAAAITEFLIQRGPQLPKTLFFGDSLASTSKLEPEIIQSLDRIVTETGVRGVVIATDPLNHVQYGKWAMTRGLSVLI